MPIPDETIEEVRTAADVVDVVGDYVELKPSGSSYKGLCPFHNEKTPSFYVQPDKNVYHCFGCKEGGDVFDFIQAMEGVGFLDAVRQLADRYGIPIPEQGDVDDAASREREAILLTLRMAARFFYHQLTQTSRGTPALDYLRGRGFTPKTIKRFGLGYAPDAWDALLNHAKEKQVEPELLEMAGLVIERNDGSGYYDRYRGRVIFPIFSHIGKVLGFGGRILDADADQPKYINSPETRVYHKKEVLYGLHQAKRAIRREDEVMLVEGYTDVISLHQAGVENAVASSGTALTASQVDTLDRYAKRVLLLYDADEAGARAATRGMDLVLEAGMGAYAVELPDGDDPDTYVREHGGDAFRAYVAENRLNVPEFKHRRAERTGRLDTPEDRVAVRREIMASIARIPDEDLRDEWVKETARVVNVADNKLFRMLEEEREKLEEERRRRERRQQYRSRTQSGARSQPVASGYDEAGYDDGRYDGGAQAPSPPPYGTRRDASDVPRDAAAAPPQTREGQPLPEEKLLLRLLLEHGASMVEFVLGHMGLDEFTKGPSREMVKAFVDMYQEDDVRADRILNGDDDDLKRLAASVMVDEYEPSQNWARNKNISVPRFNKDPREAAASAMTLLKLDRVNDVIQDHKRQMQRANADGDDDAMMTLQQKMMALYDLRKRIENREYLDD